MHCRLKYSQQIEDSWLNRHLQLFQVASSDPIFIVSSLENQNKVDLKVFFSRLGGGGGEEEGLYIGKRQLTKRLLVAFLSVACSIVSMLHNYKDIKSKSAQFH